MGNGGFDLENELCLREGNSGVIRFMKMGETNGRRVWRGGLKLRNDSISLMGEGSSGWDGEASRDVRGIERGTARLLEGVGLDPFTLAHFVVVQRSLCVGAYDCPLLLV